MGITRFFRRRYWDDERAREIASHLAMETDDNIRRGMSPAEAYAAARRKLGNVTLVREEIYRMNTLTFLETAWQDLRYGVRLLRKNPGFAVVATLSLALGIGANTAIFQLLDAVRLRSLPVPRAHELAEIRLADLGGGRVGTFSGRRPMLTNPLWEQIRDRQQGFSSTMAWGTTGFDLATGGELRLAQGLFVSGEFFDTLRVTAAAGRVFTADDDTRGCPPRAVISYAFWQREFGGDASMIGRSLSLDGHRFDIVGATPQGFYGVDVGRGFDVAVPICADPIFRGGDSRLDKPDVWFLATIGRLKPGWSIEKATAQLEAMSPSILHQTLPPRYNPDEASKYLEMKLAAYPAGNGVSTLRRVYETPLWLLLATAGLVLLIACANLANLMLARGTVRAREIAVRLAIGASRGRIVRQLLAETLVIAAIGAAAGAALAQVLSRFLVTYLSVGGTPVVVNLDPDWRVFAFTAALAVLTCVIVGLTPAFRATRTAPAAVMKTGGHGSTDSRFGLRRALVVAQMALSLILLVGALLFVRTLRNLTTLDAGFREENLLVVNLDLRRAQIPEERRLTLYQEITDKLASIPGVASAAQTFILPVSGSGWNNNILVGGVKQKDFPNFNAVSAGFFHTMGTPILAGRDFSEHDTPSSPPVAIINESFAKKFFAGRNPIGQTFQIETPPGDPRPYYEVVGIVKDTKYTDLREPFGPIGYFPALQRPADEGFQVVMRLTRPPQTVTSVATQSIADVNRTISIQYQTMSTTVEQSLIRERLMATLSGFFGGLAALLAAIGLYGMMAYMVARRRGEIGIRMALGADAREVVSMVMREAAALVSVGVVTGLVLSVLAAQAAATLLFGLEPHDPVTLALAALTLTGVAAAATFVPARRASRLDPTIALKEE